ncbi:MAG: PQQ-dependent sugar dehydrogenase [Gammaproteobacteria bacterium]|nr:PQQ-dependent sugar dehydrogenase [Gammaproteobacteria bacterium]
MNSLVWSLTLLLCWNSIQLSASQKLTPQLIDDGPFQVVKVVDGLKHPWGMAFLPDGRILITERPGRLRIVEQGRLDPRPISGLPSIAAEGQGGLMDVALHPDYQNSGWLYLAYVTKGDGGMGTEVIRARLDGGKLKDREQLFTLDRKTTSGRHFGSRLVFDRQGYLYITVGERGDRPRAQRLDDQAGSVIRLHDDGRIPDDNPFVGSVSGKPEIYSYGHRNPQGVALHPESGAVWSHEHGPQGGDEINIIHPGLNYGWPVITYGVNYGWGTKIGEGTEKPGMEQPLYYWVPSIAPSGMSFYRGDRFPQWRNSLFVGSLKFQQLVRLELAGERVVKEERFLSGKLGRIRDIRSGPDGYLYLLTDASNGGLYRLEPK